MWPFAESAVARYKPVPLEDGGSSSSSSQETSDDDKRRHSPKSYRGISDLILVLSCFTILTCTILNLEHASWSPTSAKATRRTWFTETKHLRRPNQFIGLEKVFTGGKSNHSFDDVRRTTFPTLLQQVDQTRPGFVYPVDPRLQYTRIGTISPEDRPFLVTNKISTIAQFRMRDYAMERCVIKIALPFDHEHVPNATKTERQRDWIVGQRATPIEVWTLNTEQWLEPTTLSFDHRPHRWKRLVTLDVEAGATVSSQPFHCESDSIQSFEIICTHSNEEECMIDVWQDRTQPPIGFFIEQQSSL